MPVLLVLAFIVVPILELWLIGEVADLLTWPLTIAILLTESLVGAWLIKREGRSTWRRFREALGSRARVPAVEVVDGALVLIGGTLLLTPGFLTDIVAFLFIVPPSRAMVNRFIRARVRGRFGLGGVAGPRSAGRGRARGSAPQQPPAPLDVEVVDVQRNQPPGA